MKSCWPLLTLSVVVFATGFLHAQQQPAITQEPHWERLNVITALAVQNEKMYEDIEILRRILDRKLTSLYPSVPSKGERANPFGSRTLSGPLDGASTGTILYTPGSQHVIEGQKLGSENPNYLLNQNYLLFEYVNPYPASIPFRSLEGIYLRGQGVIYTATLASLQPPAKAEADSSVKEWRIAILQQDTEWDSIRRQVRNEKEKPKKPEESKPPSLSDVLLKVLAENGHHFSQLGENESLTIVLTVHETNAPPPNRKSGGGSGGSAKSGSQFKSNSTIERQFEVNDLELLGDMHQKQGHYEEAIKTFQRAVERKPDPNALPTLYRKLAQCYLALGQDEKAQEVLDQLHSLLKGAAVVKDKLPPPAKPAAALPVKLIISAPKKLLDQVKAGKITFEEFRRQASVETLRFGDRRSRE